MFDTFKRVVDLNSRKKLQCNECKRSTIHNLEALCRGASESNDQNGHHSSGVDFSLYRCGACDSVCFEKSEWDSEDYYHDYEGEYLPLTYETQYPPPSSANFTFNTSYTPPNLDSILDEMLYALAGGKLNLATVGLRMVVEYIVNERKCVGRNLQKKLDDLAVKEIVDDEQLKLLHKIRVRGNSGAHQGISMSKAEMIAGMSIVDLLLEKLYNGPARHEAVMRKATKAFDEGN